MDKSFQFLKYIFCNHQWSNEPYRREIHITPAEAYHEVVQTGCLKCHGVRTQMFDSIGTDYYTLDHYIFNYHVGGNDYEL